MTAGRGKITEVIQRKAKELLDIDNLQTDELRLMPCVQYIMMNSQALDPNRISPGERPILARWRENGWIEGGASGLTITKEFWDAINEILWLAYVAYREEDQDENED